MIIDHSRRLNPGSPPAIRLRAWTPACGSHSHDFLAVALQPRMAAVTPPQNHTTGEAHTTGCVAYDAIPCGANGFDVTLVLPPVPQKLHARLQELTLNHASVNTWHGTRTKRASRLED